MKHQTSKWDRATQASFEWNDETTAQLRTLWDQGLTTIAIGAEIGCNKNQVIGKARRLKLPPRPSPLPPHAQGITTESRPRRSHPPSPKQAEALRLNTQRYAFAVATLKKAPAVVRDIYEPYPVIPMPRVSVAAALPIPGAASPHRECQWTDSTRRPWVFCCARTVPGRSWCREHQARVFQS